MFRFCATLSTVLFLLALHGNWAASSIAGEHCQEECHAWWHGPAPNPEAWHTKVYGKSDDRPPFAPWKESKCTSVDPDFQCPPPPELLRYSVAVDSIFLYRVDPIFTEFQAEFDATFDTFEGVDLGAAPRITVIWPGGKNWDWQFVYFGTDAWDAAGDFTTGGGEVGRMEFTSELHNFEFNFRTHPREWLALFWGVRYIEFQETLDVDLPVAAVDTLFRFDTSNFLYGFQLGTEVGLLRLGERFRLDGWLKAGAYGNNADSTGSITTDTTFDAFRNQFDRCAFVGEASLTGTVRLTDYWALRGGYQVMWIDNVAFASESITNATNTNDLLVQGGFAGFELRW